MHCYVCAQHSRDSNAVAICQNCGVAMCMHHMAELQANRPGGTEMGCYHLLPAPRDTATASSPER